jgi:hypothetical protein
MSTKTMLIMMSLMCTVLLSSCQEQQAVEPDPIDRTEVNRKIVDTYSDLAIQNAIIAQHTLYPYHFVPNGVDLNDLGQRDLSVLITHYKNNPGTITIQQGSADAILYQARAQMVFQKLQDAGIPEKKRSSKEPRRYQRKNLKVNQWK